MVSVLGARRRWMEDLGVPFPTPAPTRDEISNPTWCAQIPAAPSPSPDLAGIRGALSPRPAGPCGRGAQQLSVDRPPPPQLRAPQPYSGHLGVNRRPRQNPRTYETTRLAGVGGSPSAGSTPWRWAARWGGGLLERSRDREDAASLQSERVPKLWTPA